MKFKAMKEILYQANKTLNIVEFYGQSQNEFVKCKISTNFAFVKYDGNEICDGDDDGWYIASDYLSQ